LNISDTAPVVKCPRCGKRVPNAIMCLNCGEELHDLGWAFGED